MKRKNSRLNLASILTKYSQEYFNKKKVVTQLSVSKDSNCHTGFNLKTRFIGIAS